MSSTKSTYVPSYKLNPLNTASICANDTAVKITASTATADDDFSSNITTKKKVDVLQTEIKSANNNPTTPSSIITTPEKKKTLIEQLLQCQNKLQSSTASSRMHPAEYFMCSQSEALDRQTHMELSPFECYPSSLAGSATTKISTVSKNDNGLNFGTFSSPQCSKKFVNNNNSAADDYVAARRRLRPKYHAQFVVKKYRRSAAGGGTLSDISEGCNRSLEQLNGTVDYLIEDIFVWQMPPPIIATCTTTDASARSAGRSSDDYDPNEISIWDDNDDQLQPPQQHTPFSLSDTVAFIDDRLRAVQKDLVTLLGNIEQDDYYHVGSGNSSGAPNSSSSNSINNIASKRLQLKQLQLKQTVRKMQSKMVRYNILTSYLLSDVPPSKYEIKFGARALRTSLTTYLNLSLTLDDEYNDIANLIASSSDNANARQLQYRKECQTKDEIMAYMALLHSSAVLRSEEQALPPSSSSSGEVTSSLMEESGSGWGALLSTFCKHVVGVAANAGRTRGGGARHDGDGDGCSSNGCQSSLVEKYPRWKWALSLACLAQEGNFVGYFKLLRKGPSTIVPSSTRAVTKEEEVDNARFLLLARCCASHSLNLIRLGQLRRYNHSFAKGEKVSGKDLARLLHFDDDGDVESSSKLAIDFCRDAGLPIVERDGDESIELFVAMKSAPISISKNGPIKRICNPGRRNDCFVFGSCLEDATRRVELLTSQLNDCGIQQTVEDWEVNVEADNDAKSSCLPNHVVKIKARVDEDGVIIPSSQVLRTLME